MSEVEALRARVEQLEHVLGLDMRAPLAFGLTPQEHRLFGILMTREIISQDHIMAAMYQHLPNEWPSEKVVRVFICKLRRKLVRHDIQIETVWGTGYRITKAAKAKARALLDCMGVDE